MESNYGQIRQWYIEKLSGVISAADNERLEQWLATDSEARQVWQSMEEDRKRLDPEGFLAGIAPEEELRKVKQRLKGKRTGRIQRIGRYAAAAALLLVAMSVWYTLRDDGGVQLANGPVVFPVAATANPHVQLISSNGQSLNLDTAASPTTIELQGMSVRTAAEELQVVHSEEVVMNTLVVPIKATYRIVLPDGSKVWLNAMSKLHFPSRFTEGTREVSLEGEGYFEIAADKEKPFIVHAGRNQIHVLGTRFNVNSYQPERVETALVEGSVVLVGGGQRLPLQPGYAATYNGKGFEKTEFDETAILAWREGIYYFRNASLDDLALVINRWYGLSVSLEDASLVRHRITGLMERGDITYFLADLKASTGIAHRIAGDVLYLH